MRIFNNNLFNNRRVYTMEFRKSLMSLLVLGATHSAMSMETQVPGQEKEKKDKKVLSFILDHTHNIQEYVKNEIDFFNASVMDTKKSMFDVFKLSDEARKAIEQACTNAGNNQQVTEVLLDLENNVTQEKKKFVAKFKALEITAPDAADKMYQYFVKLTEQKQNVTQ